MRQEGQGTTWRRHCGRPASWPGAPSTRWPYTLYTALRLTLSGTGQLLPLPEVDGSASGGPATIWALCELPIVHLRFVTPATSRSAHFKRLLAYNVPVT